MRETAMNGETAHADETVTGVVAASEGDSSTPRVRTNPSLDELLRKEEAESSSAKSKFDEKQADVAWIKAAIDELKQSVKAYDSILKDAPKNLETVKDEIKQALEGAKAVLDAAELKRVETTISQYDKETAAANGEVEAAKQELAGKTKVFEEKSADLAAKQKTVDDSKNLPRTIAAKIQEARKLVTPTGPKHYQSIYFCAEEAGKLIATVTIPAAADYAKKLADDEIALVHAKRAELDAKVEVEAARKKLDAATKLRDAMHDGRTAGIVQRLKAPD
jgi:hypothetical protein